MREVRSKGLLAWITHEIFWDPNPHRRRSMIAYIDDPYEFCSTACPYCAEREGFIDGVSPEEREEILKEIE